MGPTSEGDLPRLRKLVSNEMLERGGGLLPISLTAAAREIGISHVQLRAFLVENQRVGVEVAIKLSRFLRLRPWETVRMAGYPDAATILEADEAPAPAKKRARVKA